MRKYKVNRTAEQKIPSKETIEKYKNFSQLSHAYDHYTKKPKKPLYKDKRMFLFILVIALLAYLLSEAVQEEKKDKDKDKIEIPANQ
ncbi:MAG: hypothetical protein IPG07_13645 [Crocinitomicaceae bacterium]|nr:hypothetical protein [Crocinitomicaceae bacterium]MBK6952935.1 hypothetical protein [Crocinitomicaceae bacterium]